MSNSELSPNELKVLTHLQTLDPTGDRALGLSVLGVAASTNLSKETVSKALGSLERKGYLNLELVDVTITNKRVQDA